MSLSRREEKLLQNPALRRKEISPDRIGDALRNSHEYIHFAFLLGSACKGFLEKASDIDIAVFFSPDVSSDWDKISDVISTVEGLYRGLECDLGILNNAGPTYRFEAIRGKLLFVRPDRIGEYAEFYSLTCREYEESLIRRKAAAFAFNDRPSCENHFR